MKYYVRNLLLICIFSGISLIYPISNPAVGYLHDKILEKTVPELKEFNNKLTQFFRIRSHDAKVKASEDLLNFVDQTKKKLNYDINAKKMTPAQTKAIKMVLGMMKRKASKLKQII